MKRILALLSLVLIVLSLVFSLSSCSSAEDIKGVRETESILKTNYYDTTIYPDAKSLEKIGVADYLKSMLKAENDDGDSIIICYCKTDKVANDVLAEFEIGRAHV